MRILMAVPNYPFPVVGGLERQAHELSKALVQRGHTVLALSSRFDHGQSGFEMIDGIGVHRVAWIEFRPARFLLSPFSLMRALNKLKPNVDLVHVHNISWFGAFVTLFAKALALPVITKLPNIGEFGIPGIRCSPLGFLRISLLKRCDSIIAMTADSVAELACISYPLAQVLKVPNGIPPLSSPIGMPSPLTGRLSVVFAGRLDPQKGLIDLLHAWHAVKARTDRVVILRLIGDGLQADELRALALALNLGESVEFCGYSGDVATELVKADLFVLPSYAEGNSNAILEAMRVGLPIVASRVGGAVIQVGDVGERFLFPPGDRQALADRLLQLINDESLRRHLGAAMRDRIKNVFAIDRVAGDYEQAYELILSGHREQIGKINPTLFNPDETEHKKCAA